MRVLLLEDETAIRSALCRGLKKVGHDVQAVASVAEAQTCVSSWQPELLITDLKLPDGSGLDVAGQLQIPFVIMSGYAAFDDAVQALRLGCVDFFTKPVSVHDLRKVVEQAQNKPAQALPHIFIDGTHQQFIWPEVSGFGRSGLVTWDCRWYTTAEAVAQFGAMPDAAQGIREQQLLAEIMQLNSSARLIVNRTDQWWRVWLEADLTVVDALTDERHHHIDHLADACWWRENGLLVECRYDQAS